MEEILDTFENFKISALSKCKKVNPYVKNVTIGPNKVRQENSNKPSTTKSSLKSPEMSPTTSEAPKNLHFIKIANVLELNRREDVQNAINKRLHTFVEHNERQKINNKAEWQQRRKDLLNKLEQEEIGIIKTLEENEQEDNIKHQALIKYYQSLAEKRKQNEEKIKINEEKQSQRAEVMNKIMKNQVEFREIYQEITTMICNNRTPVNIRSNFEDIRQCLQSLPNIMNEIVVRCQSGIISENDAIRSQECVTQIKNLKNVISKRTELIDQQKKMELKKQSEEKTPATAAVKPTVNTSSVDNEIITKKNIEKDLIIEKFMSKSSLKYYNELQSFIQNYPSTFRNLSENKSLKQFRFDCKKAVNIPVNAISAINAQHLLDKYNRLCNLLSGNKVIVGGTEVIASKHPEGIAFCMDLLAKKFVLQGDLMISSNPEAAFCYATMILSLWNQFPDFGKLFLLHLHKECVYLIPFYPPRLADQTDEDYYKSLGYNYTDGAVEKQDKFLKRMTGIMRLYAAIIISKPKSDQKNSPHNIVYGWRWFSAFLNLEPQIDITATMIHVFLEVAGSTMQHVYGKQFYKLMEFLSKVYMPMLKKYDSGGPFTRLEVLLHDYQRTGQFEKPKGLLPINFW